MNYKDNNITVFLTVEFYKKKEYRKPKYLFLTDNMKNSLSNSNEIMIILNCYY